jgi:hypothetical protein
MTYTAALLACIVLACLALFQLALALGAPIGRYAWGGGHRVLPTKLRVSSAISIVLYTLFALVVLNSAEIITIFQDPAVGNVAIWVLFAYFAIGIFMNAISRSKPERNLMTPVAAILAVLTLLIALS